MFPIRRVFICFLVSGSFIAKAQQNFTLPVGSELFYEIENKGKKYDLIVTLKQSTPELEFAYLYKLPTPKQGSILIKTNALEKSNKLYDVFAGSGSVLNHPPIFFLGKNIFYQINYMADRSEIVDEEGVILTIDTQGNEVFFDDVKYDSISIKINGEQIFIKTLNAKEQRELFDASDWAADLIVINDEDFPLILKLSLGWTLTLKEIKF